MTMTTEQEESPGEVLCRVLCENPNLIVAECERIARAIIEDRKLRTPATAGRIRRPEPHAQSDEPTATGEHQQF